MRGQQQDSARPMGRAVLGGLDEVGLGAVSFFGGAYFAVAIQGK